MLYNLSQVMQSKGMSRNDLAHLLGTSRKTIDNKIEEVTEFTKTEIFKIKLLFPQYTFEYLFATDKDMGKKKSV